METQKTATALRKLAESLRAHEEDNERRKAIKTAKIITAARGLNVLKEELQR